MQNAAAEFPTSWPVYTRQVHRMLYNACSPIPTRQYGKVLKVPPAMHEARSIADCFLLTSCKFRFERLGNLFCELVNDPPWIRCSQIQNDVGCTSFNVWSHTIASLAQVVIIDRPLDRAFNGIGVTPNSGAMPIEHLVFMTEGINVTSDKVPDTCILSDHAQCQPLAAPAYNIGRIGLLNGLRFTACIFKLVVLPIKV